MNGKDGNKSVVPIAQIFGDGNMFFCNSKLPLNKTAQILINLAMNMIRQDEKNRLIAANENNLIHPRTGKPIINNTN